MTQHSKTSQTTNGTHTACIHDGLCLTSQQELLDVTVPFLGDGLAAGQLTVLLCEKHRADKLHQALGYDRRLVRMDRSTVYKQPVHALSVYQQILERQKSRGVPAVRMLSETGFGPDTRNWISWHTFEAAVNHTLAP